MWENFGKDSKQITKMLSSLLFSIHEDTILLFSIQLLHCHKSVNQYLFYLLLTILK